MMSATERERMVRRQIAGRGIDDPVILNAFRIVPRELFIPEDRRLFAYDDGALPIDAGQTISQPYIVALMIEAARIGSGSTVLEVGAGSGYAAAVISHIAAKVVAIERHQTLARAARERIDALGYGNCTILAGDGLRGCSEAAPFDAILVSAAGLEVPEILKHQLKPGGTLVMPVGGDVQSLHAIRRMGDTEWESRELCAVRFVPLLEGHAP